MLMAKKPRRSLTPKKVQEWKILKRVEKEKKWER